ncbi:hypothetical protein FFWV33_15815 [Flavobacterium faecale]|uniref:Uncharacterized protein n=1 Tax=Flavobacterium faecale TaxID=1355330 RepID=A0A2S1LHA7_9FLAO|nr:hypothetical protein FFWV33_15815 [Flavobacterium faecale]
MKKNTIKPAYLRLKKKRERFVLLNYLNLFIDIPIVAEVERFRSTAVSLLAFQAQRNLSCWLF